jgi:hypothetical protein
MADELTISGSIRAKKGETDVEFGVFGQSIDWTGTNFIKNRQVVGTTVEAVLLGDVALSSRAWFFAKNHSATDGNYVTLRNASAATGDFAQLGPGETCGPIPLKLDASTALYAIATSAAADLEYLLVEY